MTPAELEKHAAEEAFRRGYHGIPDDGKLQAMSYIQLSELLHSSEKDSTKFHVIEREMKKHLAKDQARINRSNIILGACIGLAGVFIGGFLRSSPPCNEIPITNTVNQDHAVKPPLVNPPSIQPATIAPTIETAPAQSNAQPSKPHP